jgi:hypothetical protein
MILSCVRGRAAPRGTERFSTAGPKFTAQTRDTSNGLLTRWQLDVRWLRGAHDACLCIVRTFTQRVRNWLPKDVTFLYPNDSFVVLWTCGNEKE